MVGVPGRTTTGCHTCRRRKVKCDRTRPTCERCRKARRECEGYERGAVFLNRTAEGMRRRQYLDEALPRRSSSTADTSAADASAAAPAVAPAALPVRVDASSWVKPKTPSRMSKAATSIISPLLRPLTDADGLATSRGLYGHLVENWMPTLDLSLTPLGSWILHACGIGGSHECLDRALGALSFTMVGWQRGDPAMVCQGRAMYTQACGGLQRALWDSELVMEDATLAAIQAMKMYEFMQPTQGLLRGFDSHVEGAIRLLRHRGPARNASPVCVAILRDMRYSALAYSLQYGRKSPLGGALWRIGDREWTTSLDVEHSLLDRGFDVVGVAVEVAALERRRHPPSGVEALQSYLNALAVADGLHSWYDHAVQHSWLSAGWPYPQLDAMSKRPSLPEDRRAEIDQDMLRQSLLMLDYWALLLALSFFIRVLHSRLPASLMPPPELDGYGAHFQMQQAEHVLAVLPYQSREEHGFGTCARCLLATRTALAVLHTHSGSKAAEMRAELETFTTDFFQRRQVGYAVLKSQYAGPWGESPHVERRSSTPQEPPKPTAHKSTASTSVVASL